METSFNELFENKTVLITGGTGFLGQHLIKSILPFNPHSIRVFSRDEVKHHLLLKQFQGTNKLRPLIGDVRDYQRLKKACEEAHIVIHAAALKRLDLIEYNVDECIKTNVMGTMNVVQSCLECNVEKAVFVSSDKACSPANTYGASKFMGERIFTESNHSKGAKKTLFTSVRYGNVLESTGSVIPFFQGQIKAHHHIPLTDSRMTRFIIHKTQAAKLIFDALKYAIGGEIFVPHLPSFKIVDIIEALQEGSQDKCPIDIVGLRPGEKIHEILINHTEIPRTCRFKDLYVIAPCLEQAFIEQAFIEQSLEKKQRGCKSPQYILEGIPLEKTMDEYSSKDHVLSKEEVKKNLTALLEDSHP